MLGAGPCRAARLLGEGGGQGAAARSSRKAAGAGGALAQAVSCTGCGGLYGGAGRCWLLVRYGASRIMDMRVRACVQMQACMRGFGSFASWFDTYQCPILFFLHK